MPEFRVSEISDTQSREHGPRPWPGAPALGLTPSAGMTATRTLRLDDNCPQRCLPSQPSMILLKTSGCSTLGKWRALAISS
jgi:hypothetical protein